MAFNLDNYEDVQSRVKRFQKQFPVGRIVTDVIQFDPDKGHILVAASVYREHEDTLPASVDYAYGLASTFPLAMRKFYVEDTVTSAIGRALSLVLEGDKKPTREDMARVEVPAPRKDSPSPMVNTWDEWVEATPAKPETQLEEAAKLVMDQLDAKVVEQGPECEHGTRVRRDGVSAKTGKPWAGWFCGETIVGNKKCDTIWIDLKG